MTFFSYAQCLLHLRVIKDFSVNKLVTLLGIHAHTVKKRLRVLFDCSLASLEGENLVLRSVVSKHAKRNVKLGERKMDYSSLKCVEYSLQAILVIVIQSRKDFAKRTIRNAHGDSRDYKVVKSARSASRKFGYGLHSGQSGRVFQASR